MGIQDHPDTTTIVRQTSAYENTPSTDVHGPKFCDPACLSSVLLVLAQQDPLMSGPGPAHLLPTDGFTILRLAHIPNTPTSQKTIDN